MSVKDINNMLRKMRESGKVQDYKDKGDLGENAALSWLLEYSYKKGGKLYHSFKYPYASNSQGQNYIGNVVLRDGEFIQHTDKSGLEDEIDILYVTKYRIFVIEVKSYHAKIEIDNKWVKKNSTPVDKSPIWQSEKHCRHLYHSLYEVIPDGQTEYIVPICCFVDRCTVVDKRDPKYKAYIHVCILNNLIQTIDSYNTPLKYGINLEQVITQLNRIKTGVRKEY